MSLDEQFGRCEAPGRYSPAESVLRPRTLFVLSHKTASRLLNFIDVSQRDQMPFACFPFVDFTILWLVNATGEILVAIEEGVRDEGRFSGDTSLFPLPNVIKSDYVKLGHPSLVGCEAARIGGELVCDLEVNPPQWYLTNRSGRYGLNLGRTEEQLANVADELGKLGIRVGVMFF